MTTIEKLRSEVLADIQREETAIKIHNAIYRALLRFDGKKVNKRIETYVLNELMATKAQAQLEYIAGMTYLRVWGVKPFEGYGNYSRHFLGYAADMANYNPAKFTERDACNGGAAILRNEDRHTLLGYTGTLEALAQVIDDHNAAIRMFEKLTDESPGDQARYAGRKLLIGTQAHEEEEQRQAEARRRG